MISVKNTDVFIEYNSLYTFNVEQTITIDKIASVEAIMAIKIKEQMG